MSTLKLGQVVLCLVFSWTCCASANETSALQRNMFQCFFDWCSFDDEEFCSQREKRCASCEQDLTRCMASGKMDNIRNECRVYCYVRLLEQSRRQSCQEQLRAQTQNCTARIEAMAKKFSAEQERKSTVEPSPDCPQPAVLGNGLEVVKMILAVIGGGTCVFLIWKLVCYFNGKWSSRQRCSRHGGAGEGSSMLQKTARDADEDLEAGGKDADAASSGFGSKDTAVFSSKNSLLPGSKIQMETPGMAALDQAVWQPPQAPDQSLPPQQPQQDEMEQDETEQHEMEQNEAEAFLASGGSQMPPSGKLGLGEGSRGFPEIPDSVNSARGPWNGPRGHRQAVPDGKLPDEWKGDISPPSTAQADRRCQGCEPGRKAYHKLMQVPPANV